MGRLSAIRAVIERSADMTTHRARSIALVLVCFPLLASGNSSGAKAASVERKAGSRDAPGAVRGVGRAERYAQFRVPIAGVAGGRDVVFVGQPLHKRVVVLSRSTGKRIGVLPPPPGGFSVPFIMHAHGSDRVEVLDAGRLPQKPFRPANPSIYQYRYSFSPRRASQGVFSASLERTVSFSGVPVGFSEDFVRLQDGRLLVSDAVLGSIWVVQPDGTITPGIVPKSFDPPDAIPALAMCVKMPEVTVNGHPFLFTGSTLPGVSPLAVRDGTVYYASPCARGIYAFPLAILSDDRQPYQRAADIHLVAATPPDVQVEELLDFTFNPFDPSDRYLYAADPLELRVIRIDLTTGARQVVAGGSGPGIPKLFDFPSSLGFLPPIADGVSTLVVASNQQERTPLTNDAVRQTTFDLPFTVAKVFVTSEPGPAPVTVR
jgi:hypothetical protein